VTFDHPGDICARNSAAEWRVFHNT
jgi:hypothetical protein